MTALDDGDDEKAAAYRRFGNGAVARLATDLLPAGGSVLDVGCASGGLLALLRPRAGRTVGIELSPVAAGEAATIADEVLQVALDGADVPLGPASFDLVVCADVLEHTVDPSVGIGRAASWVKPGGHVVVSVPNIGHWTARLRVLAGRWRYEETGIFDSGHLRFFTLDSTRALVAGAGLDVVAVDAVVPALRNALPLVQRLPGRARRWVEAAWQRLGRRRPSLLGYQVVVVGRRPGA